MSDSVFLMLPQGDFRVHAGEHDMASVILAGAGAVHFLVVLANQRFTALRVFPNPILERILDKLLLLRRKSSFLGIEYAPFPSVCILYGIIDTDVAEIQRIFQQAVGIGAVCTVGGVCRNIVVAHGVFAGYLPLCRIRHIVDLDGSAQIPGRFKGFVHELLNVLLVNPCCAQAHFNFAGFQIFGLRSNQGIHIPGEERVTLRRPLCGAEFLAHITGEVFIGGLPSLAPIRAAILQIKRAGGGVFVDYAFQVLYDLRDFIAAAHKGGHEAEIYTGFFSDADCKCFAGGVYGFNTGLLLDGALVEHIRFALQLPVIVQHFQRTQEVVRGIVRERKTVCTVI